MLDVKIVDLRSDTITKPTPEMLNAMYNAAVGDDVFGEDPSVKDLEELASKMFEKEAALYFPSGTMGNFASVLAHCWERGSEVLLGDQSHIHLLEQGNISQFGNVHARTLVNRPDGTFDVHELRSKIRRCNNYALSSLYPISSLVCLENTHNMCHGAVLPQSFVSQVSQVVREHGLKLHVDGARFFNAAVALDSPVAELARPIDSVSLCLAKGLCCPIGTVVVGDRKFIEKAERVRKAVGGGMRQAGYMAAPGIYALKHMIHRLREDHERAYLIARTVNQMKSKYVAVDLSLVQTNIVYLNIEHIQANDFCDRLMRVSSEERSELDSEVCKVRMIAFENRVRFLTSQATSEDLIELAVKKLVFVINQLEKHGPKSLHT